MFDRKGLILFMKKRWGKQACGIVLSALLLLGYFSPQVQAWSDLPDSLELALGQKQSLWWGLPLNVEVVQEETAVLSSMDETLEGKAQTNVDLSAQSTGSAKVVFSFFGLKVKDIDVKVEENRVLVPGGQVIGVALHTSGVLVVGTSELTGGAENPAKVAGLKAGDLISTYAGETIENSKHLMQLVEEHGTEDAKIEVTRAQKKMELIIKPSVDQVDGKYRLGVWVRDSTAGVGTLSFYDPASGMYGALGHAITDVDTGEYLTVREGTVMHAQVVDVLRGKRGEPGELKGSFLKEERTFGNIQLNNQFGIYGQSNEEIVNSLYPEGLPIASQASVHEGAASIICSVDGEGVKEYEVEITRCVNQKKAAQKGMNIKVTDAALLEKTGGIVQGMSGSPIIQDGRIVGCVTHVYVNDPTQGYGMYIEWMLEQTNLENVA